MALTAATSEEKMDLLKGRWASPEPGHDPGIGLSFMYVEMGGESSAEVSFLEQ